MRGTSGTDAVLRSSDARVTPVRRPLPALPGRLNRPAAAAGPQPCWPDLLGQVLGSAQRLVGESHPRRERAVLR
eukprot:6042899-Lingulodinium_polyedra.AAC.1